MQLILMRSHIFIVTIIINKYFQIRRRRLANVQKEQNPSDSPLKKRDRFEANSPVLPPIASPSFSSPKNLDKVAMSLNLLLEQIFLITVRKEGQQHSYIDAGVDMINASNLSEILLLRLTSNQESAGCAGYLVGCYRRLLMRESSVPERVKSDLQKYVHNNATKIARF
jgi:hypothetical protein